MGIFLDRVFNCSLIKPVCSNLEVLDVLDEVVPLLVLFLPGRLDDRLEAAALETPHFDKGDHYIFDLDSMVAPLMDLFAG